MALSPRIKGNNKILWGSAGILDTGIITSARNNRTGKKEEIPDNIGFTNAVIFFDDQNQCEVEALLQSYSTPPERGDMITLFGTIDNCLVDDIEKKFEQKGVAKYSIKATAYDGIPNEA